MPSQILLKTKINKPGVKSFLKSAMDQSRHCDGIQILARLVLILPKYVIAKFRYLMYVGVSVVIYLVVSNKAHFFFSEQH